MKDKRSWFSGDDPKTLKADKRLRVDSLPSKLMTVKAAAEMLGFGTDAIYEWVRSGRLGCEKIGRNVRISEEHIKEFLFREAVKSERS